MGNIFDKVLKKDEKTSDNGWYKCAKCGKKFRKADMEVDHTKPRSKGGGDDKSNLQLICKYCSRSK